VEPERPQHSASSPRTIVETFSAPQDDAPEILKFKAQNLALNQEVAALTAAAERAECE
jgi:hypothetical protein